MLEYDWSGWTDWSPLSTLDFSTVPETPGAYVIATDRPVNRAVGIDPDGVLDVGEAGKSKPLRVRLQTFYECASNRNQVGHFAGWRFAFYYFDRHFPVSTLRVRWLTTKSKEEAAMAEGRLLLAYKRQHCELPPLNNRDNWKVFEKLGWAILDGVKADA